jgi:outer membrane receptor protein involved in Fe transport
MTESTFRAAAIALLTSTALASPALAQTAAQPAPAASQTDNSEIIITATKRSENMQNVPISVQVLGTKKLDQLNISNFEEYTKQLPSVSFQTAQPGVTVVNGGSIGGGGTGNLAERVTTDVGIARVIYAIEPAFRPLAADLVSIDPSSGSATARRRRLDE